MRGWGCRGEAGGGKEERNGVNGVIQVKGGGRVSDERRDKARGGTTKRGKGAV